MWIVVAYDVSTETKVGRRRLRHVAQVCQNYGQRVQKSLFECQVNEMEYETLRRDLLRKIDEKEDNLRLYRIVEPRENYIEEFGQHRTVFFDEPLVL